jgi:hypothetical protein
MNIETMRVLLAGCLVAMVVLAMFYLRHRPLSPGQMTFWMLFALLVPALGPFLVILNRPGSPHLRRSRRIWR